MSNEVVNSAAAKISTLFEERMRLKGPDLRRQVYKAGRRLPRTVRKNAKVVLDALEIADHPKLLRMIDVARFEKAARVVTAHLSAIDPRDEKIGRVLVWLGKISAVLIVGFVLTIWVLWSRGSI